MSPLLTKIKNGHVSLLKLPKNSRYVISHPLSNNPPSQQQIRFSCSPHSCKNDHMCDKTYQNNFNFKVNLKFFWVCLVFFGRRRRIHRHKVQPVTGKMWLTGRKKTHPSRLFNRLENQSWLVQVCLTRINKA